jgi:hypothetical protein
MELNHIIAEITDQADEFLGDKPHRDHAQSALETLIERDYFELSAANRTTVIAGVLAALEAEERFGMEFVGDPFKDEPEPEKEGEK